MDWDLVLVKVFLEVEEVFFEEVVARSEETSDSLVHVVQSLKGGSCYKTNKKQQTK